MHQNSQKPLLLLVDGHSLAFRSFYAFSKNGEGGLTTKSGDPTSVTYGFLKALLDNCKSINPQGVTIAFDTAEPTFRHKADPNYKANREVAPPQFFQDLDQLEIILKNQLNLEICKEPGYEADDVLGTLSKLASDKGWRVCILSGDRDLFQLIDDKKDIAVMYLGGGGPYSKSSGPKFITESGVLEKLGVAPNKVVDLKALTGDASDNIPGVKGVGPKTAINLLKENIDLDGIYEALSELEAEGEKASKGFIKGALKSKLREGEKSAYKSRYLAEILIDVPLSKIPSLFLGSIDEEGLKRRLEELELRSLARQMPDFVATFSKGGFLANKSKKQASNSSQGSKHIQEINTPQVQAKVIKNLADLNSLKEKLLASKDIKSPIALDTETTDLNPFKAELVGIGFCWGENINDIAYIPISHNKSLLDTCKEEIEQISIENVISAIGSWIESDENPKVLQNAKFDRLIFLRHGLNLGGVIVDSLLADYIKDPNEKHSLASICERRYGFTPDKFNDLVGKGKTFADVDITSASKYCGMDVFLTRKISLSVISELQEISSELINLLINIEQPLEKVLADMESTGIRIDVSYLKNLSSELKGTIKAIEESVYNISGSKFNLASPKQLGEILFEGLGLDRRKSRKTKTGWSTDANVLERLENDHPIISKLIEHRTLSKLLSTYVDALPELVEEETGRVHTDFNQAITSTGRLSSSNPNLQNIPIRTELSKRIRKAFLPEEGWILMSADYSQIELRILAHLSEENILVDAYKEGEDVHELTAKILLEKESISPEERRLGKTINFGVIYGMGALRFSRSTGVSQLEAKEFLQRYKERYQKVFSFLELQQRLALSRGFVKTILGRRRYFKFDKNGLGRHQGKDPNKIDLNLARRGGLEAQQLRAAANAPIQGSSADIIKLAMVSIHKKLKESNLDARLLLQVHDELVLEVKPHDLEKVQNLVKETMEKALPLKVPLVVDIGLGGNWMEAK